MKREGPLTFHVLDLPPEGIDVRGDVSHAALDIAADEVVSFAQPWRYELNLAPVQDGVLVRGRLAGAVVRVCDRCLEEAEVPVAVPEVCHHFEHVEGALLDLTEVLREDILLAFPQAWVCRADCRGLCPQCGCNLNRDRCRCVAPVAEPDDDAPSPWGVLDGLLRRDRKG